MATAPSLPVSWKATDDRAAWPFTRLMFQCAAAAYLDRRPGLRTFRSLGLDATFLDRRSTQAYVARTGTDAIVAFRGTERSSMGDILTDLKFIRRHTPDGRMHSGFWGGYENVHGDILRAVRPLSDAGGRVWLTGHSLGGALAVVAAYRLGAEARTPVAGVITFGQPMVVMPDLAENLFPLLHDRTVSFVNGRDVIPRLVWPYVHVGTMIRYHNAVFERRDMRPPAADAPPHTVGIDRSDAVFLQPLDDADLDALIERLESRPPIAGEAAQGILPALDDHALHGYSTLVDAFLASGA